MAKVTMDETGRVVIPPQVWQKAGLMPGEELIVVAEGPGEIQRELPVEVVCIREVLRP